jgi:hypothetical protein
VTINPSLGDLSEAGVVIPELTLLLGHIAIIPRGYQFPFRTLQAQRLLAIERHPFWICPVRLPLKNIQNGEPSGWIQFVRAATAVFAGQRITGTGNRA